MKLIERMKQVNEQIADDIALLVTRIGDLTSLGTTDKSNLVAALNEVASQMAAAGASINDEAGNGDTAVTWSADKIYDMIEAAKAAVKAELVNGSPAALDTLNELSQALGDDPNFATTLAAEMNKKLDFTKAQTLSASQRLQGCENLGIGNPDTDFKGDYLTRRGSI